MNTAIRAHRSVVVAVVAMAFTLSMVLALGAASASAVNVDLRIEGESVTHFNGVVNTGPRSVAGGVDSPSCRANGTANDFAEPNALTAAADALGTAVTTSGTFYGWGTLLCSVNGEAVPSTLAGWLIRINNKNNTAPGGYVTATTELSEGDSVLFYMSPEYTSFSSSLDVQAPATAAPGQPFTIYVDEYEHTGDTKSPAAGVSIHSTGVATTTAANGTATISLPSSGRFLVTANKSGAVRGSAWVTVDPATPAAPIARPSTTRVNRFSKCGRVYRKNSRMHRRCIRIVRAKQRAEKCTRVYRKRTKKYQRCIRIMHAKQRAKNLRKRR